MKRRRKTFRRGRTRPDRAALLDALLGDVLPLPESEECVFVDVGYGDNPTTTERTHNVLIALKSKVQTIGVEVDQTRVARANATRKPGMSFVRGGFDLCTIARKNASFVRCLNVLRGYSVWEVKGALLQMGRALGPRGLLLEGTSDVEGTLAAVHIWRRNQAARLDYEGLLCVTNFSRGFSPWMFRDVLPRDLRRHTKPGEPVFEWLAAWDDQTQIIRKALRDESHSQKGVEANRRVFAASVACLASQKAETDARFAHRGVALFKPERPSTRPEVLCPDDLL